MACFSAVLFWAISVRVQHAWLPKTVSLPAWLWGCCVPSLGVGADNPPSVSIHALRHAAKVPRAFKAQTLNALSRNASLASIAAMVDLAWPVGTASCQMSAFSGLVRWLFADFVLEEWCPNVLTPRRFIHHPLSRLRRSNTLLKS